jgi:hypothetical protein
MISIKSLAQDNDNSSFQSAHKASILSAIIPGTGQIYNKKYWKAPIIYASLATSIYFIYDNNNKYNTYKEAYLRREQGEIDDYFDIYNNNQLITITDYYQRNRDVSYIITTAIYLLNIVDASVDAHLFDFDISEDLSINYQPTIIKSPKTNTMALSLKMNF